MLKFAIHIAAAVHFGYAVYYDWNYVHIPLHVSKIHGLFGRQLKYLTYWNAIIQVFYFTLCTINDLIGSDVPTSPKLIRRLKDFIFCSLAFPLALFVGISFWGLMAIDRELVLPKSMDPYFPTWLNHVMHSNVVIFALIEMATSVRRYPKRIAGLSALLTLMAVYLIWIHVIYYNINIWVYPILNVLNATQRIYFFAGTLLFGIILYFVGEFINYKKWEKELTQSPPKRSKRKKN